MKISEIIHKLKIKEKHKLVFRKNTINVKGDNIFNLQYKTLNDGYIISKLREAAAANNCEILSYFDSRYMIEGRVVIVKGLRTDYVAFCADFCNAMQNGIKDIEF